jgi:hypothetical protein
VAYNVLSCYVDVVSIIYRYANDSFITNNTIAADLNMTRRVALFADTGYIYARLPIVVEGAGLVSGDYAAEFALELSRELIAMTAYTYKPGQSLEMHTVQSGLGARLQLVPLVLLVTVLVIYWCVSLFNTIEFVDLIPEHQHDNHGYHCACGNCPVFDNLCSSG